MWNINSSHRHATLQAFEGMQLLIYLRLALRKKKTSTSGLHLSKAPFPPLDYIYPRLLWLASVKSFSSPEAAILSVST